MARLGNAARHRSRHSCHHRREAPASSAGPYLAPGRLEVPVSSGTPTNAASSPSADACTGSLIMEQTPTGRATSRALGGTLNRELQQRGALLPGTGGWRNPADALAGEVARRAGGRRLGCEVVTIVVTADLGVQSPAPRGSSCLQAAQSRGLILTHTLPTLCPTGNAARGAVEPVPSWGRAPAASAKPPCRDQSAPDTPLPGEGQEPSPASTFTLPATLFPNGIVLANTGNKHGSEEKKPVQELAGQGRRDMLGDAPVCSPQAFADRQMAAFVALTACTFNLHFTKAPRMLKNHKNVSLAEGKENKREV